MSGDGAAPQHWPPHHTASSDVAAHAPGPAGERAQDDLDPDRGAWPEPGRADGLPRVPGRALAAAAVLAAIGAVAFAVATGFVEQRLTGTARLGTMVFVGVIGMIVPVLAVGRRLGWGWRDWGFRRPRRSLWHALWQVPLAVMSSATITAVVMSLLGQTPSGRGATEAAFEGGSIVTIVLVVVAATILAPLVEEMLFRRMLLDWLRQRTPVVVAVLVCALIFAAVHVLPAAMLYVGLVGLWMTVLRVWSGALWHSVILHAANNTLASIVVITAMS